MKFSLSLSQLAVTTVVAGSVFLGAIAPSQACMFSKGKGTEVNGLNSFKSGLNNLDAQQIGLMGAGVLFLGGVAASAMMSRRASQPQSDEWEVSQFSIPVPPEALESSVEAEEAEELTSIS